MTDAKRGDSIKGGQHNDFTTPSKQWLRLISNRDICRLCAVLFVLRQLTERTGPDPGDPRDQEDLEFLPVTMAAYVLFVKSVASFTKGDEVFIEIAWRGRSLQHLARSGSVWGPKCTRMRSYGTR